MRCRGGTCSLSGVCVVGVLLWGNESPVLQIERSFACVAVMLPSALSPAQQSRTQQLSEITRSAACERQ